MATEQRADSVKLTLGASAPWVRRNVGPVAWAVREALAEHEDTEDRATVSYRSVRDLATDLGLSNDTIARALRRLAAHGLAQHHAERSSAGRFAKGHYLLSLPPDVLFRTAIAAPTPPTHQPAPPPEPPTTRRKRPAEHQQLDLLDQPPAGHHR